MTLTALIVGRRARRPRTSLRNRPLAITVLLCTGLWAFDAGAAPALLGAADPAAPLLADDGSAYPPSRRVAEAETGAGGPAPGWADRAQRDQLERLHPQRVVRLDASALVGDWLSTLDPDAWVFVEGRGEQAVRAARRLVSAGVRSVWVMLPEDAARAKSAAKAANEGRP